MLPRIPAGLRLNGPVREAMHDIDDSETRPAIHLKDPTEPEVWVGVVTSESAEVRGRLMGPRCRYSSTVEVAYPFRPAPRPPDGLPGIARRAIIPEASQWEPTHPFLYEGPVELWEGDRLVEERHVRCGIRYLHLGSRGLHLNGRLMTVRGVRRDGCSAEEMTTLREQGVNLVVADVAAAPAQLWADADEVGMLVLGIVRGSAEAIEQASIRQTHPCNLGWLLVPAILEEPTLRLLAAPLLEHRAGELLGLHGPPGHADYPEVQFRVGPPGDPSLPCLALSLQDLPDSPGLIGTVRP